MVGPKTRRYLASKQDPAGSVLAFMRSMEEMAKEVAQATIEEMMGKHRDGMQKMISDATEKELKKLPGIVRDLEETFKKMAKAKIASMPKLKGDPGYTPVKGVDYHDGLDGRTPVAGIDFFSRIDTRKLVIELVEAAFERMKREGMTKKEMRTCMEEMFSMNLMPKEMARALEGLSGTDRLDYEALKNRPGTPVEGQQRHTLHRGGGGKQTYYYDLSDLCNGVDKTFAIPTNTRVVAVSGTDAPGGIYRPVVDWTGTGTTTLTLTDAVAAPQTGATLYILYVV